MIGGSGKIPSGYKFQPTDKELIEYLVCKAKEESLPGYGIVKDVDIYSKEPSELFEGSKEKFLFFFTKLKKKHGNGSRIDRTTRVGTWKGLDTLKPIKDCRHDTTTGQEETVVIGGKRNFSYIMKSDDDAKPAKGGWNMTEYNLHGTNLEQAKVKDYVICRIKRQKLQEGKVMAEVMEPQHCNIEKKVMADQVMEAEQCNEKKVMADQVMEPQHCNEKKVMADQVMEPQHCNEKKVMAEEVMEPQQCNEKKVMADQVMEPQHCNEKKVMAEEVMEAEQCNEKKVMAEEVMEAQQYCNKKKVMAEEVMEPQQYCNEWVKGFAEELLVLQNQEGVEQEPEIVMLPNVLYAENWSFFI